MDFQRRGIMLVLASPSGAGEVIHLARLFGADPDIQLSVSVTTRGRRTDEVDGKHTASSMCRPSRRCAAMADLLRSRGSAANFCGTPRALVEEQLSNGNDILFDIDYQGTLQLYEKCRADMVTVFILPPSIKELRARLERRAQDSVGTIEKRLRNARNEMDHATTNTTTCSSTKTLNFPSPASAPSWPRLVSIASARSISAISFATCRTRSARPDHDRAAGHSSRHS